MTTPADASINSAPVAGTFCAACGAALSIGARFCHRCGTPAGETTSRRTVARPPSAGVAASLPWYIAFGAMVVLVAVIAGRNSSSDAGSDAQPAAAPMIAGTQSPGSPPNIANLSPSERASRLYGRIMEYSDAGKGDSVAFFAPMAISAHEMLESPTTDERYHFGQIGMATGNAIIARAQADTILKTEATSLLGLVLASRSARLMNESANASAFDKRLLQALESELARKLPEYEMHRADINRAVAEARHPN